MAQAQAVLRLKAKKMFKAPMEGGMPVMINPGDVIETKDRYLAWSLVTQEKAEFTEEKPFINPNYKAPERPAAANDPTALLVQAVGQLTKVVQELVGGKQQKLQH